MDLSILIFLIITAALLLIAVVELGLLLHFRDPPRRMEDRVALEYMMELNKRQTNQIFAFHKAGQILVETEVRLARSEADLIESQALLERAKAEHHTAEIAATPNPNPRTRASATIPMNNNATETNPPSILKHGKAGGKGHTRIESPTLEEGTLDL